MLDFYLKTIETCEGKSTFIKIHDCYVALVHHIVYGILENKDDVEDCLQDVFLFVAKNISKFEGRSVNDEDVKKEICYIARCKATDYNKKYHKKLNREGVFFEKAIEDDFFDKFEYTLVAQEMKKLSESERNIIVLKYLHNYSHEELAEMYKTTVFAMRKRLQRAKDKLAKLLEEATYNGNT